jgi:hypothetical protein
MFPEGDPQNKEWYDDEWGWITPPRSYCRPTSVSEIAFPTKVLGWALRCGGVELPDTANITYYSQRDDPAADSRNCWEIRGWRPVALVDNCGNVWSQKVAFRYVKCCDPESGSGGSDGIDVPPPTTKKKGTSPDPPPDDPEPGDVPSSGLTGTQGRELPGLVHARTRVYPRDSERNLIKKTGASKLNDEQRLSTAYPPGIAPEDRNKYQIIRGDLRRESNGVYYYQPVWQLKPQYLPEDDEDSTRSDYEDLVDTYGDMGKW